MGTNVNSSLDAISAKLERAAFQISEVRYRMAMFFLNQPFQIRKSLLEGGQKEHWAFELSAEVPLDVPLMTGEALHNLRSVLDQVCSLVAEKAGKTSSGVLYPFGNSEDDFLKSLKRQTKIAAAHDLIKAARPFPGPGGDVILYALHDLNRRDKHRPGLVPIAVPGNSFVSRITFWQGLPFLIGSAQGKHLVGPAGNFNPEDLKIGERPQADYHVGPGQLEFSRAPIGRGEVIEFMVTTPNAIVETDFRPSFEFVFDEPGLEHLSATIALERMREAVCLQVKSIAKACLG